MNKILAGIVFIIVIGLGFYFLSSPKKEAQIPFEAKNSTFTLEGTSITLKDGYAAIEVATGSASQMETNYFGNEVKGDLDNDGKDDYAFLVTENDGGSGTFYYVVVALGGDSGYRTINTINIGDRIAPQTNEIKNGQLIVNYADRKPNDPMSAMPSVGVTKVFVVSEGKLMAQ